MSPSGPPGASRKQPAIAIGCDMGGTATKLIVLLGNRVLSRESMPTPRGDGRRAAAALAELAAGAARRFAPGRQASLGVALPGLLDARRARPLHVANLPHLEGIALRSLLERRTGWPVILEPDSNAGAYGEAILGAGRGGRRVLYLTVGTGVGAALVAERRLVRVANHTVGQVAHLPLEPGGPPCPCGAVGCAESVLSARGIVWRARRAARRGADLPAAVRASPAALYHAAQNGSRDARRLLADVGKQLGALLAILSNLFSPDRVVVGGGIAQAGDLILAPAAGVLRQKLHPRLRGRVAMAGAALGLHAGAAGAALLAREAAAGRIEERASQA